MIDIYGKEAVFLVEEGASPAQVDQVLKSQLGMAMGLFEMSDLSGNDVGWRLRLDFGFTGEGAAGPDPSVRYSTLPDKLCENGWFGQKTKQGWYKYDPSSPRRPIDSPEAMSLIDEHRKSSVRRGKRLKKCYVSFRLLIKIMTCCWSSYVYIP
jgi:3-hydroxyacyl-CoA dehydrogenase